MGSSCWPGDYEARENQTLQLLPWVPGVEADEIAP